MKCNEVIALLDAYIAGELSPDKRAKVDLHVETCDDCLDVLERAKRLESILSETQVPPVPDHFASQVLVETKNRRKRKASAWSIKSWWRTFPAPMRAASAAILLTGAVIGMAFGWKTAPVSSSAALVQVEKGEPVLAEYGLDALGDAPKGSLAESYQALLEGRNGKGR